MKKETLYNAILTVMLAWAGWVSLLLISIGNRLVEVETKLGIQAKIDHATDKYATFELLRVPDFFFKKEQKK